MNRSSTWQSSSGPNSALLSNKEEPKSLLSAFLEEEEEEDENDFTLMPPDKFNPAQQHLCISVKFYLGGKSPEFIGPVDLSRKHIVKDVIRHVLTLYRKNKDLKIKMPLEYTDCPEAYELRHVDEDSDSSCSSEEGDGIFYRACYELPALELDQEIS